MYRRTVVSTLAAALAASGGCLGPVERTQSDSTSRTTAVSTDAVRTTTQPSPTTATGDEHTVSVERRVEHAGTGLERVLTAADGGEVALELTCPDGTVNRASATVDADAWGAFERQVLNADVAAYADRYECAGECPGDAPPARLRFVVDGRVTEVVVEPTADRPDSLDAILAALEKFADTVSEPSC